MQMVKGSLGATRPEKSQPSDQKKFVFSCDVEAFKLRCYFQTTVTCENRHHVTCGYTQGIEYMCAWLKRQREIIFVALVRFVSG